MANVLYKRVDYKLENLLLDIETGKLGLPDLQRPFVWQNSKVRDLFDSMMKGYPVGYLMLWDAPADSEESGRQIGLAPHTHETPKQLIIDGQQRLTSLYAVMYGKPILDSKFKERPISIAFNPVQRKFEVTSAAHRRSAEWIAEISEVYKNANSSFSFISSFISDLDAVRQRDGNSLTGEEQQLIAQNIQDLLNLKDYMIPTLCITDDADEEAVADVFVRVNSGGKNLNENDFILTLISVHDERERKRIEKFCQDATIPVANGTSFNQLFAPKPSHIIRVVMAYGFKRARLKYAYMLLRGKDMEKGIYRQELREEMFAKLTKRLDEVLNLNNWHSFINCILSSGYLSPSLIASENALVYSYVMYLIGKYNFGMDTISLRKAISKWFYMVSVSSYYTGSYETDTQSDLNVVIGLHTAEEFQAFLTAKISAVFTQDFFRITLPEALATSAAISPAWNAFCAAQNILGTKVLFSTTPIRNLFSPGASGTRSAIEKHHLFPKEYLPLIGIVDDKLRNQIANFTYIEWPENCAASDSAPEMYWSTLTSGMTAESIGQMCMENALPDNWTTLPYPDFLEKRRMLMAEIIRKGYDCLCGQG